ncbi:di-trans,poly-cis-decaprenylcistransferase [Spiribacter sp. SSL99]|uniref:polyprenyl diphosphate synthase n=1 Tax=Spiribacter sp. SSL99 TaxID=1866884 RepID=UPI001330AB57|nr:polyprenyl diphosphate synthase [Spiribacter sp. SSL99]KAF0284838.1 di-trans,poly-cis-decaprenylcistransferase [Spiribacter sp. SSL99]
MTTEQTPPHDVVPRHVAVIMDGNGRWAAERGEPRHHGHRAGAEAVRRTVEYCARAGVEALTLFAFSSENWQRPAAEVSMLMSLFMRVLDREAQRLQRNGIRLNVVGDRDRLSRALQARCEAAEALTADETRMQLNIAASYGGRWDIAQAARRLAEEVAAGERTPESIDADALSGQTCLHALPAPDLFIRTGGEQRISNFLLWQMAYTELYFTPVLWPDFDDDALGAAFDWFARRERRFGRVSAPAGDGGTGDA